MFDGYALISKIRFDNGKVYGSQRYVDSTSYKYFESSGGGELSGMDENMLSCLTLSFLTPRDVVP
jgi:carotenoid cleavage dioxygenase-like enzyme